MKVKAYFPKSKEPLMSKTLGVGIVGCGFVGYGAHVPAFSSMPGARLVAIADADQNRREKITKKYGVQTTYADYAELCRNPEVELVVVSAPTTLHAQAALAAIKAGKHVLCEMPLAVTLAEADEMIDAAQRAGVLLMPSLNFHFTPNYVKAKQLMDQGAVGTPTFLMYREFIPARDLAKQWPPTSWMWKMEESGGPLYTLAVWSIDLLRWLTRSDIVQVTAATKYTVLPKFGGTFGYDASASVKFGNGMVGCLQYSATVGESSTVSALEIIGDANTFISAVGNDTCTLLAEDPCKSEWKMKEPGPRMWGHAQMDEYYVRCVLEGRTPDITPADGRRAMEIAWQIAKAT